MEDFSWDVKRCKPSEKDIGDDVIRVVLVEEELEGVQGGLWQ